MAIVVLLQHKSRVNEDSTNKRFFDCRVRFESLVQTDDLLLEAPAEIKRDSMKHDDWASLSGVRMVIWEEITRKYKGYCLMIKCAFLSIDSINEDNAMTPIDSCNAWCVPWSWRLRDEDVSSSLSPKMIASLEGIKDLIRNTVTDWSPIADEDCCSAR